jgi:hypothetical protein
MRVLSLGGNHSHTEERGQLEHRQRVAYIYEEQEAVCQVRNAEPTTAVNTERNMKNILDFFADFFALVGLVSTIIVVCFYMGYTQHKPECSMWVAALTKECK